MDYPRKGQASSKRSGRQNKPSGDDNPQRYQQSSSGVPRRGSKSEVDEFAAGTRNARGAAEELAGKRGAADTDKVYGEHSGQEEHDVDREFDEDRDFEREDD